MDLEEGNNSVEVPATNDGGKTRMRNSVSSSLVRFSVKILNLFKGNDSYGFNLEKQLQAWRKNPSWVDQPPTIKQVLDDSPWNLNVEVDIGLPPDTVYNMLIDPNDERIFKNTKSVSSHKLLVNYDRRQVMEVAVDTSWSMFWWSWGMSGRILLSNNKRRAKGDSETTPPKVRGWFGRLLGCERGKGRLGSRVSLTQGCPEPFLWRLRGIKATPDQLVSDLVAESAKVRESLNTVKSYEELKETADIKERWSIRRKMTMRRQRKLSAATPTYL